MVECAKVMELRVYYSYSRGIILKDKNGYVVQYFLMEKKGYAATTGEKTNNLKLSTIYSSRVMY